MADTSTPYIEYKTVQESSPVIIQVVPWNSLGSRQSYLLSMRTRHRMKLDTRSKHRHTTNKIPHPIVRSASHNEKLYIGFPTSQSADRECGMFRSPAFRLPQGKDVSYRPLLLQRAPVVQLCLSKQRYCQLNSLVNEKSPTRLGHVASSSHISLKLHDAMVDSHRAAFRDVTLGLLHWSRGVVRP